MYLSDIPRPSSAPPESSKELILPKQQVFNPRGGSLPYGEIFRPKEREHEDHKFRGFCRDQDRGPSIVGFPVIETQTEELPVESQPSTNDDIFRRGQQRSSISAQHMETTSRAPSDEPHSPTDLRHSRNSSLSEAMPNSSDHQRQTSTNIPLHSLPPRGNIAPHSSNISDPPNNMAHISEPQNQYPGNHVNGQHSPSDTANPNKLQPDRNGNDLHPFKPWSSYLPQPPSRKRRIKNAILPLLPPPGPWRWVFLGVFFGFVAIVPTFAVRESSRPSPVVTKSVTVLDVAPTDAPLASDSFDVEDSILGTYFSTPAEKQQTFMVYGASLGRICIRSRLNGTFGTLEKCIENANPKPGTSFSIVDWLGGPTIGYITSDNFLSTINHIPAKDNDTWAISTLLDDRVPCHPLSKISSVTWTNGTALWLMYQGPNGQIREYGLDDFRNRKFRAGSHGDIAPALNGSTISAARYGSTEELCYQSTNTQINCRRYANGVWGNDEYVISSTESGLSAGSPFSLTTMNDPKTNVDILLAIYAKSNGAVNLVTRSTTGLNATNIGLFSSPVQIGEVGAGNTGLVINSANGVVELFASKVRKIFWYTSDTSLTTWTKGVDVSSS